MNAQIKRLLKEADERYPRALNSGDPEITLTTAAFEQFTQLVVKECCGLYECIEIHGSDWGGTDDYRLALHKHFGVK